MLTLVDALFMYMGSDLTHSESVGMFLYPLYSMFHMRDVYHLGTIAAYDHRTVCACM
jgi:hypothetical protein